MSASDASFAPTRWSLVRRARGEEPAARAALSELCEAYWAPVFRFLVGIGHEEEIAREITQEFFAHVLNRGAGQGSFAGADPTLGRFRSFLLGAVKHFLADRRAAERRLKRGGGALPDSLDAPGNTTAEGDSAGGLQIEDPRQGWDSREFDRHWATALTARVVQDLEQECVKSGRQVQFLRLRPWLMGDGVLESQAALANELGLSEGAIKVAIHRLRKRFRELVRIAIADTVPAAGDVDEELRYLISVLGREV